MAKDDIVEIEDDGLDCRAVSPYVEEKHRVVSLYSKLFSSGMKSKWPTRVYLELYSGPGYGKMRGTGKLIPGSPIRALMLKEPFDKYIFCERDEKSLEVLKKRVEFHAPSANVSYVPGNCNEQIDAILREIPAASSLNKVLTLCFVDPSDIGIKFKSLEELSARYIDFLVLLALYMDANRNIDNYVKDEATKIDEFLGSSTWREKWKMSSAEGMDFPRFLAEEFSESMAGLDYQKQPFYNMKSISISEVKKLRLYKLALFSRHPRAYTFWDQVLKYSTAQKNMFEN